jgi:ADP-dependent NAD(P)H-hydrate dehydratase
MIEIDADWLRKHPLPHPGQDTDKNKRGRVLVAGGAVQVPGGLQLTGEAALRAGAGKVQLATVEQVALGLGLSFPEAAVIALPANDAGELHALAGAGLAEAITRCDVLVLGPGTGHGADAQAILSTVLSKSGAVDLVLDAAFIAPLSALAEAVRSYQGEIILTPHPGEMASLMGCEQDDLTPALALHAAERFGATIVMKGSQTVIASATGELLQYPGGGPGLATAGSGDVLAGLIGGLSSRGTDALASAAWSVYLHGQAGRYLAARSGSLGFLARELLAPVPMLMEQAYSR